MKKDTLRRYRTMRDFDATPEPRGEVRARAKRLSYVVQRHDATRLHYDFRLEWDGVLKSWAVPKGPSLVPGDKRLAVEVEDHPLDYGHFEGAIPEGHYGAGHVLLWDEGTWEPEGDPDAGLAKGRLSFRLEGKRLHGGFSLVRMRSRGEKQNQWLLLKTRDAHAKAPGSKEVTAAARVPKLASFHVQLATLDTEIPKGDGWIFEPKLDGYRALASIEHGKVRIESRTGQDWTARFEPIRKALAELPIESAVMDGEVCALDENGIPSFQKMQNAKDADVVYYIFDLLFVDGFDVRDRPLETRKAMLASILGNRKSPIGYVSHSPAEQGAELFELACRQGVEGVVAKRKDQPHRPSRTREWIKVKCQQRQELVIVGFTAPGGSRPGLGALLLGVHDQHDELRYVGKVGTGFTARILRDLHRRLTKLAVDEPAVARAPRLRNATWVKPSLVAEVRFTEWTKDGALRHPAFVGLREDKPSRDVVRESREQDDTTVAGVRISHPERVLDRTSGTTKIALARYIESVSPSMLPHVERRPLALVRCPEGDRAECFFQKQRTPGMPKSIHSTKVGKNAVIYVQDAEGLVSLAQFGAIELHGWGSRIPNPLHPNQIVMDIDPDVSLPFTRVVEAALALRDAWKSLGLTCFVKTTGGKGLHVVVPIAPELGWDDVKDFTHAIALRFEKEDPHRYTSVMSKRARHGKIFIDYLRNGHGATAIVPFSPRARPGAPVAMPVAWRDLAHLDPQDFTVETVPKVLARRRKDPWAGFFELAQRLPSAPAERRKSA
ncbi:DNA ligase D [Pendulispora rubella]|uniref:DNA ligase (ATP) n=1 Tax=Pendulispora rubella TaxID=2741070 RepID=A0ABZ2KZ77_9BACT